MSKPTLTVSVPCPTCGGRRSRTSSEVADLMGLEGNARPKEEYLIRCPDCTDGTIRQAVSCAECKWFYRYGQKDITPDVWGMCLYDDGDSTDPWIVDVSESHGCLSWEAKA